MHTIITIGYMIMPLPSYANILRKVFLSAIAKTMQSNLY